MNKSIKILFAICLATVLFASDEAGGVAGAYLRMSPDARTAALGNATTALYDDVNISLSNPASVPTLENKQFSSSFQFLSLDRSYQTLSFGITMPPNAGMAISWIHAGVDNIEGRNYSNDYTNDYSWSQDAFIIGFGLQIIDWLSVGISGKILSDQLANSSSSGFSADIGLNVSPIKNLLFAIVVKDISGKTTWDTSQEPYVDYQTRRVDYYPTTFNFGLSYNLMDRVLFTGAYKYSETIEPTWHAGVEARVWDGIYLRAGANNGAPSFGLGTSFKLWKNISSRMDYAFITGTLQEGGSHLFTWLFNF